MAGTLQGNPSQRIARFFHHFYPQVERSRAGATIACVKSAAIQSPYGTLFRVKIVLFVAMLGLAAANRFRPTPAFGKSIDDGRTYPAFRGLRLSLILELSLAAAILGLVAWLGTLEPPVSM